MLEGLPGPEEGRLIGVICFFQRGPDLGLIIDGRG